MATLRWSILEYVFDMNLWGRDRDRAVQRSPALEFLDELFCGSIADPLHFEVEAHGVEQ